MNVQAHIERLIIEIKRELVQKRNLLRQKMENFAIGGFFVNDVGDVERQLSQVQTIEASIKSKELAIMQLQAVPGYLHCMGMNAGLRFGGWLK